MVDTKKDRNVMNCTVQYGQLQMNCVEQSMAGTSKIMFLARCSIVIFPENLCNYINSGEIDAGNTDFDFAKMPDEDAEEAREGLVEEKGFFILPSELFCNVRANAANDENLNETLERVFRHIEESAKGSEAESDFAGLFDDYDVNSNKLGATVAKRNEKLVKLLNGVAEMNLGDVKDHSIDAFGDAYEYLMTMYASNAGKSGGEFFTPDIAVISESGQHQCRQRSIPSDHAQWISGSGQKNMYGSWQPE